MSTTLSGDDRIVCKIDGGLTHSIQAYIKDKHPDWTIERYKAEFPDEPLLSEKGKAILARRRQAISGEAKSTVLGSPMLEPSFARKKLAEVFNIPEKQTINGRGQPIECTVLSLPEDLAMFVPDVDPAYVFNIELVKTILIGIELGMNTYLWGYHGTGKTSAFEQVFAHTNRPWMRVQHSSNTEEAHILGQWTVRDGSTEFQLGPLPDAMLRGLVYCADEYDFAMPSVTAVYQPVLEGKSLIIKDAPPELRVIKPHPNFRFVATGNTNGGGDETGLYQGTQLQNAANYSRFAIVEEVEYMEPKIETAVVSSQARCSKQEAGKLIEFANKVREEFRAGKIGSTISPRELIAAAKLGLIRSGDFRAGLRQAFLNRCSRTDKVTLDQYAQRMFG